MNEQNPTQTQATTAVNHYIINQPITAWDTGATNVTTMMGQLNYISDQVEMKLSKVETRIHPELYFKFIKSKFGTLEGMRMKSRLAKLEKAFNKAVENGQEVLGRKFMTEFVRETRESVLYAKGIRHFIEREDLQKYKNKIRDGHISDTLLKEYTRVVPEDVLAKKNKFDGCFDGYVVYHYWEGKVEEKRAKEQKLTPEEKQKMRDPVLFGIIRESDRLYFIADWEDEFCDLKFDEIVDRLGKDDKDFELTSIPKLNV
jgi:hypothetical protein